MLIGLFLFLSTSSWVAAEPPPPKVENYQKLWGPLPKNYSSSYLAKAKKLKAAIQKDDKSTLSQIVKSNEWTDYALWALAKIAIKENQHREARRLLLLLKNDFAESPISEEAHELYLQNQLALGLTVKPPREALKHLERAFFELPSKRWVEHEDALRAWITHYEKKPAVLREGLAAELLAKLPNDSQIRRELPKIFSRIDWNKLAGIPRTRSTLGASGIKAEFPDQVFFEQSMALVLEEKWSEANIRFTQFPKEFPESEMLDRALYWEAKSLEELGKKPESKEKFQGLWQNYPLSYYGLQAALHLGVPLSQAYGQKPLEPQTVQGPFTPRQWQALWRTRALIEADFPALARREAEYLFNLRPNGTTLGQEDAESSLSLARLYFASTFYLGAFTQFFSANLENRDTLTESNLDLIFPSAYWDEIVDLSGDIDPVVILSLTKQESAFLPDAVSRADAMGLMQLLIPTAKEVDAKLERLSLIDPRPNIKAGSAYLKKLLDRFGGNLALALAGYNAGPQRASQWQKKLLESPMMKKNFRVDVFIDSIPFTETRRYVGAILRNIAWYKTLKRESIPNNAQELALQWRKKTSNP